MVAILRSSGGEDVSTFVDRVKAEQREGRRKEDAHLRQIERCVRDYIENYYSKHPSYLFANGTRSFVEHVGPVIEQLDFVRAQRRSAGGRQEKSQT